MKKPKLTNAVSEYMSEIGTKGGLAGKGSHANFTSEMGKYAVSCRIKKYGQKRRKPMLAWDVKKAAEIPEPHDKNGQPAYEKVKTFLKKNGGNSKV